MRVALLSAIFCLILTKGPLLTSTLMHRPLVAIAAQAATLKKTSNFFGIFLEQEL